LSRSASLPQTGEIERDSGVQLASLSADRIDLDEDIADGLRRFLL